MVVSATSIMRLERLAAEGGARWFQAYLPGEPARIAAMVDRVAAAGFDTFVLTVDVPVPANRENNTRTGFSIPLRPSLRLLVDGLAHPAWSLGTFARTLRAGMPHMENMDAHRGPPILSRDLVRAVGKRDGLSWDHVDLIRRWRGRLVLKGCCRGPTPPRPAGAASRGRPARRRARSRHGAARRHGRPGARPPAPPRRPSAARLARRGPSPSRSAGWRACACVNRPLSPHISSGGARTCRIERPHGTVGHRNLPSRRRSALPCAEPPRPMSRPSVSL